MWIWELDLAYQDLRLQEESILYMSCTKGQCQLSQIFGLSHSEFCLYYRLVLERTVCKCWGSVCLLVKTLVALESISACTKKVLEMSMISRTIERYNKAP